MHVTISGYVRFVLRSTACARSPPMHLTGYYHEVEISEYRIGHSTRLRNFFSVEARQCRRPSPKRSSIDADF